MYSVVFFTNRVPSKLSEELMLAGYRVFEAFEVSEVLHLCDTEDVDVVLISAEVKDPDVIEAQMRRITIRLKPDAATKDLISELTQLFPQRHSAIQ